MEDARDTAPATSTDAPAEQPVFEPSWRCVARHVAIFTSATIGIGTFGQWVTNRPIWSVGYIALLALLATAPFTAACFAPQRVRTLINKPFELSGTTRSPSATRRGQ